MLRARQRREGGGCLSPGETFRPKNVAKAVAQQSHRLPASPLSLLPGLAGKAAAPVPRLLTLGSPRAMDERCRHCSERK